MIKKILVPLDGSELAEKALPYAEALAEKLEAELILTWVLHPLIVMSDYGASSYETIITLEKNEATQYLTTTQIKLQKQHLPVRINILEGHAADAIIELACQEGVGLIVMSTHGRSGLSRWVHGSVATKVLQQAPCPVFLVRVKEAEC
jgi:nucleotide-binding universal stress UspA family protein